MAALEVGVIAMGWSLTPLKATEALEASSDDDDVLHAPGLAEAHQGDVPGRDDDPGSDYLPDAREEEEEEEVVVEESNGERCAPRIKEHVESLVEAESLKGRTWLCSRVTRVCTSALEVLAMQTHAGPAECWCSWGAKPSQT